MEENKLGGNDGGNYSASGSSAHYKNDLIEFIDNIERMYGTVVAYLACESNVIKYRGRAGKKEGVPVEKDIVKAQWYETCGQYLREKIDFANTSFKDLDSAEIAWSNFEAKYGAGREYIEAPLQIKNLFTPCAMRSLGEIVDGKLDKK